MHFKIVEFNAVLAQKEYNAFKYKLLNFKKNIAKLVKMIEHLLCTLNLPQKFFFYVHVSTVSKIRQLWVKRLFSTQASITGHSHRNILYINAV